MTASRYAVPLESLEAVRVRPADQMQEQPSQPGRQVAPWTGRVGAAECGAGGPDGDGD
jgi:hypothetical protein